MIGLSIPSGSRSLAAYLVEPSGPASGAGLLFVHGLRSDQSGYLERAAAAADELGCTSVTFDLSGHGASPAEWSELFVEDSVEDLVAAYDVLVERGGVDLDRIGICGASYGAYLTGHLIDRRPVARVLLRVPALYGDDVLKTRLNQLSASDADVSASRFLASLSAFDGEALIVESERDEAIPHRIVERYVDAFVHGRHHLIKGATHQLTRPAWRREFMQLIVDWFRPLSRPPS